mgnify:FL=1
MQTYPATEYDFHPVDLVVGASDYVHIQWTGNDNTNNNGNNNGEGTNNEDRHNIVQLGNSGLDVPMYAAQADMFDVQNEWNPEATGSTFGGTRTQTDLTKQFALSKQQNCDTNPNNDQARDNCQKLNQAAATVNMGLLRFKPGTFTYMSSRNNNFSNRAQKAKLSVLETPTVVPPPPVNVTVQTLPSAKSEAASVKVTWSPPGSAYKGTDGKEYWGMAQVDSQVIAYMVQYSYDGGDTWLPTPCVTSAISGTSALAPPYECTIENLPAGTPTAFRVRSGSSGGW